MQTIEHLTKATQMEKEQRIQESLNFSYEQDRYMSRTAQLQASLARDLSSLASQLQKAADHQAWKEEEAQLQRQCEEAIQKQQQREEDRLRIQAKQEELQKQLGQAEESLQNAKEEMKQSKSQFQQSDGALFAARSSTQHLNQQILQMEEVLQRASKAEMEMLQQDLQRHVGKLSELHSVEAESAAQHLKDLEMKVREEEQVLQSIDEQVVKESQRCEELTSEISRVRMDVDELQDQRRSLEATATEPHHPLACSTMAMGWRDVLDAFHRLPRHEQRLMVKELDLDIYAGLEAWCDQDFVPSASSPRPRRRSTSVRLRLDESETATPSAVTGCPWCRRPVSIVGNQGHEQETLEPMEKLEVPNQFKSKAEFAYTTLLYGPQCHHYFLGALVLGEGLQRFGGSITRLLLHTADVPKSYLEALATAGWVCREVEYLSKVAWSLFKNWHGSRFIDVFTKLRVLEQEDFEKVLFLDLDLLVRDTGASLAKLFDLNAPAAMKRGAPIPSHGALVPYSSIWAHPIRRQADSLPQHQQASGINAGVMLLKPSKAVLNDMISEVHDYDHPQHYGTYMPEQEYISRFYGTFDQWTHIACNFNFEIDKNERIPHDFTEAHEEIRNGGAKGHNGAVILHFSGCGVKPWDLIFSRGDLSTLKVQSADDIRILHETLLKEGPKEHLEGYQDQARLWDAMLEWLGQFRDVSQRLKKSNVDVIKLLWAQRMPDSQDVSSPSSDFRMAEA
eukprot:symbB.v1.2.022341.t1/scaffold1934.1/size95668/7